MIFSDNINDLTPAEFVRELQDFFFSTDPNTGELITSVAQAEAAGLQAAATVDHPWVFPNNVTPQNVMSLIDLLEQFTNAVDSNRTLSGAIGLGDRERLLNDLAQWRGRLAVYRVNTATALGRKVSEGTQFDTFFADTVVNPLLRGWYLNQETHGVVDAVTPLILARALEVEADAMQEAWDSFLQDIATNTRELIETGAGILVPVLLGLAALGVVTFAYSKGSK